MLTELVDPEGFPRSDIDVAGVRTARAEIHRLRNDLTDTTNRMATLLQQVLARQDDPAPAASTTAAPDSAESAERKPFAKVDGVFPGGPADQAVSHAFRALQAALADEPLVTQGLKREDLLLLIGSVSSMSAVAALVATSQDVALPISILRPPSTTPLALTLTPRANWGGRGLLGMHIVPV